MNSSLVTTHPRIALGKEWIFYVRHDHNGKWSFLPVNHSRARSRCRVSLSQVIELDPSVKSVLKMPRGSHAHRQYPGAKWHRSQIPSGPTRLLTCEAIPMAESENANYVSGAFIHIWIRGRDKVRARRLAAKMIRNSNWRPITKIDQVVLTRNRVYRSARKYFDQVQTDGEVMVFYSFAKDED